MNCNTPFAKRFPETGSLLPDEVIVGSESIVDIGQLDRIFPFRIITAIDSKPKAYQVNEVFRLVKRV
jgi:hypothetical protein